MTNDMAVRNSDMAAPLSALAIRAQVQLIQEVMREVMQGPSKENPNGVHFGLIPGCGDKPSLFKPGAEKLFLTFRLRPIIDPALDVVITELPGGHRDYRVHCHILNMQGVEMATGVGSASTLESKHRYRGGKRKCPQCGAESIIKGKEEYGGGWLCFAKKGGCGAKFADNAEEITGQAEGKVENPDIADQYNTVLKMACKRAKVDGCLSATACSDIFTQDIEDFSHETGEPVNKPAPKAPVAPNQAPQRKTAAPTQDDLEAKAAQAKAAYHAPEAGKAPPAKPQTPPVEHKPESTTDSKFVAGIISYANPENKGGFRGFAVEGQQNASGRDKIFQTKSPEYKEKLLAAIGDGTRMSIQYNEVPWGTPERGGMNYAIVSVSEDVVSTI